MHKWFHIIMCPTCDTKENNETEIHCLERQRISQGAEMICFMLCGGFVLLCLLFDAHESGLAAWPGHAGTCCPVLSTVGGKRGSEDPSFLSKTFFAKRFFSLCVRKHTLEILAQLEAIVFSCWTRQSFWKPHKLKIFQNAECFLSGDLEWDYSWKCQTM